ncbi:MAG: RCC1 domain-containing protein, partial [Thermoflexales bacterium]
MKRFTPAAVIALSLLNSLLAPPTAFARPAAPPAQQTPQPRYNFAAIHLSGQHACALTMQGGVLCWGSNQYGQLGNGTTKHSGQPVKVRGLDKGVRAVAMNDRLTCALTERGGVLCWGYNQNGQLGDGTKKDRSVPVPVRGLGKGV